MKCLDGTHGRAAIPAVFVIIILTAFIAIVAYLASEKTLPCCKKSPTSTAAVVLKVGLKAKMWWVWDLIRRVVIVMLYVPTGFGTYPGWVKQHLVIFFLVCCLAFHLIFKPYREVKDLQQQKSPAFFTIPKFLRRKNACNALEGFVLLIMIMIALLSGDSKNAASDYSRSWRLYTIYVMLMLPAVMFWLLIGYKVYAIVTHRWPSARRSPQARRVPYGDEDVHIQTSSLRSEILAPVSGTTPRYRTFEKHRRLSPKITF